MQLLKTLFWVVVAVGLALWGKSNWTNVTVKLWGGLMADVKLPLLILAGFLLGFLPTYLLYRTRIWSLRRRLVGQTAHVANSPVAPTPVTIDEDAAPAIDADERVATDTKVWPAS